MKRDSEEEEKSIDVSDSDGDAIDSLVQRPITRYPDQRSQSLPPPFPSFHAIPSSMCHVSIARQTY